MAKKPEAQADDLDNQIDGDEGMGEFEEEGTADIIRKILADDGADDDGGLDQPMDGDEKDLDVISTEKGQKLVEDAQTKRDRASAAEAKGAKTDKPTEDKPEAEAKAEDAAEKPNAEAKAEDAAPDLSKAAVADLVKDVPEAQRAELTRRLGELEKVNTLFAGREAEMQAHGMTSPADVIGRLLHLNAYAQKNPGEYIAWVARETGGDKAHEALSAAAQHLGYKLVQDTGADEGDDDPFMTDREREQAAELKRLKAAQAAPQNLGPMAPHQVAAQQAVRVITDLKAELDPATGAQKRPYWGNVEHLIAQRATAHRQQTQAAPTRDDLARFYDESVAQMTGMFGGGNNSAAQTPTAPAQRIQQTAEATARAKAASKTIDGTGQGASRRPALSDDAPLDEVIRHAMAQQQS